MTDNEEIFNLDQSLSISVRIIIDKLPIAVHIKIRSAKMQNRLIAPSWLLVTVWLFIAVNCNSDYDENSNSHALLSRRRRYLIFPSGATLQVGKYKTIHISQFYNFI